MSDSPKPVTHINLEFAKKEAKSLLKLCRSRDAVALARMRAQLAALNQGDDERLAATIQLADIHYALARESGFSTWAELKRHEARTAEPDFERPGNDGVIPAGLNPWHASLTYTLRTAQLHPTLSPGEDYRIWVRVVDRVPETKTGYADLYWRASAIAYGRADQLRCALEGTVLRSRIIVHGWYMSGFLNAAAAHITLAVSCLKPEDPMPEGTRAPTFGELEVPGGETPYNQSAEAVLYDRARRINEGYNYVDLRDGADHDANIFLVSYGEYVPQSQGLDYRPYVERAESLAKFHVPFLERQKRSSIDPAKVIRREWFCATNPDIAVVHIYLQV